MHEDDGLMIGPDSHPRCYWAATMMDYHDGEWGRPRRGDRELFERICLEGFQSGLSWLTILRKRDAFRRAFHHFDIGHVARFTESDIERLMADADIIRNRAKIVSAINNARRALELIKETGSLSDWLWSFAPKADQRSESVDLARYREHTTSAESIALSKALKKRGWSYVGPTTMYAMMQAVGMVNDHLDGCFVKGEVGAAGAREVAPSAL